MDRDDHSRIEETTDFWSQRTGEEISLEDGREAAANAVSFFQLLSNWDDHATEITESDAQSSPDGPDRRETRTANRTCPN